MSTLSFSNARYNFCFSATTVIPICVAAFYAATFLCVPLFATKSGQPVPVDKIFEVLLLPFALLGTLRALRKRSPVLLFLLGYFALASLSSIAHLAGQHGHAYPAMAAILGVVLDLKPFVFGFGCYELLARRTCDHERAIALVIRTVILVALINGIFVLRDLVVGGVSVWGIPLGHGPLGLPLAVGLYNHKYPSACTTLCGALAGLSLVYDRFTAGRIAVLSTMLVLLVFNGSMKEVIAVFAAVVLFLILPSRESSIGAFRTKAFMAALLLMVGAGTLSYMSQMTTKRYHDYAIEASVRSSLHIASYSIAKDNFPIGSGAGTFASMPSRDVSYSPLYYQYGIFAMYQGGPLDGSYLMDVWWPHVLAESGFIGCACYLAFIVWILWRLKRQQRTHLDGGRFFLLSIMIGLMINSVAAPTFTMDILQPLIGISWGFSILE